MRYGILTFHNADNYGAVLQCYALQQYLKHIFPRDKIYVIDHRNVLLENDHKIVRNVFLNKRNPFKNIASFFCQLLYIPQTIKRIKSFQSFRSKYLQISNTDFDAYDTIYFGSDQIWNLNLTGGDFVYFGDGISTKKVAYAASDGNELNITNDVLVKLKNFDSISCRESNFSKKLAEVSGIESSVVCDPVFLLGGKEWSEITTEIEEKDYIFIYQVIENLKQIEKIKIYGKNTGKKIIEVIYVKNIKKWFKKNCSYKIAITPQKFVSYIKNASEIYTTSFHGTAFSIIFRKNFYSVAINKRSERITDLLNACGLSDRYISDFNDTSLKPVVYSDAVEQKIEKYILCGRSFLDVR